MLEPEFLTLEDVLELHAEALRRHGGSDGLRDAGLLDSALAQPQANFGGVWAHPDIFSMAAAYAFHLSENQAFIDGNKRVALAAALAFLVLNGVGRTPDPRDRLYDAMLAMATRTLTKDGFADLLAELSGEARSRTGSDG